MLHKLRAEFHVEPKYTDRCFWHNSSDLLYNPNLNEFSTENTLYYIEKDKTNQC